MVVWSARSPPATVWPASAWVGWCRSGLAEQAWVRDGCAAFFKAVIAARGSGVRLVVSHVGERAQSALDQVGLWRNLLDHDDT